MFRYNALKTAAILISCFLGCYLTLPTLLGADGIKKVNQYLPTWIVPQKAITLGLDLQGGSHVVMEVDVADLTRAQVRQVQDDVRRVLRENRVAVSGGVGIQNRAVQVRIPEAADREKALPKLRELSQPITNAIVGQTGNNTITVQELPDGVVRLEITEAGLRDKIGRAVGQSIEVIRRRIDGTGTTEPQIQRQGLDRVLIQVPGLQDPQRLKVLLGSTAKLEFRLVADTGYNPAEVEELKDKENPGRTIPVERRIMVQGEDLISAEPGFDSRNGEPVVNFRFNVKAAQVFGRVTTDNVGKPFAIVLDNEVISAPRIISPITGGSGQISGRFTIQAANDLSTLLRAGALPAKMTIVEERTVGAGLGQDSIEAAKLASWVALVLIVAFTLATYGFLGIIALTAVAVNVGLIFGFMSLIGTTLTLPGIAGIVLTVGMAIDSNVLIYERIREESRMGRSVVSSLDAGFTRALATIVDANLTTLIAGAVLFFLGSGPVKGFAVTLSVGIVTTVFTAFTLTRLMVATWYRYAKPKSVSI
ncbi:MAG: protein translocase subunit SecD [Beijerinckiaceae bacterium]